MKSAVEIGKIAIKSMAKTGAGFKSLVFSFYRDLSEGEIARSVQSTIFKRLMVILLVFFAVPIGFLSWRLIVHEEAQIHNETLTQLQIVADGVEAQLLEYLNYLKGRTEDFGSDGFIRDAVAQIIRQPGGAEETVNGLNQHLAVNKQPIIPEVEETFVTNLSGVVIASSEVTNLGGNYAPAEFFLEGQAATIISDVFVDDQIGQNSWVVSTPLTDKATHELIGVLVNRIRVETLSDITSGRRAAALGARTLPSMPGHFTQTYLVNRDRLLITGSTTHGDVTAHEVAVLNYVVDTEPVRLALEEGREMIGDYESSHGNRISGVTMIIDEPGWVLVTEMDFGEAYAPVIMLRNRTLAIFGMLIFGLIVVLIFITQRLVIPIGRIVQANLAMAAGDELTALIREDVIPNNELGEVMRSRNLMLQRLQEREQRKLRQLSMAVEQMSESVVITDEDGTIEYVNPAFESITGFSEEEALGNKPWLLNSGEHDDVTYKRFWKTIFSSRDYQGVIISKRKNGELFYEERTVTPILTATGDITHYVSISRDITKRVEAEEALVDSENRYRTITETATDAIITADEGSLITLANPAAVQLFGYSLEELVGQPLTLLMPEKHRQPAQKGLAHFIKTGEKSRDWNLKEMSGRHRDGHEMPLEISYGHYVGDRGMSFVAIIRDVSERKKVEEVWHRYAAIVNTSTNLLTLINRDYEYEAVNDAYCRAHNKSRDEIVGRKVVDLWGQEVFKEAIEKNLRRCFQGEEIQYEAWFDFDHPTEHCFDVTYYPYYNEEHEVTHVIVATLDITERKQAEAQLAQNEAQLQTILQASPDYVWMLDKDFKILYGNRAGSTQSVEDLIGMSILSLLSKEKQAESKQHLERALKSKTPYRYETKVQSADGPTAVFENIAIPVESDGQVVGLTINSRDITERKRAEEALKDSEERYRHLFDNSPIGIGLTTFDGKRIDVNKELCRQYGYTKKELMSISSSDLYADSSDRESMLQQVKQEGGVFLSEHRNIRKDGGQIITRYTAVPITIGNQVVLLSMSEDITERKQTEEALKESEIWFRSMYNSLEETVLIVSPDRALVHMNLAGQKMFGYSEDELKGLSTEKLHVDRKHYLEFGRKIKAAFDRGAAASFEFELKRKNGDVFPTEHTVSLLKSDGDSLGIVSVVRDITERKQAEAALQKSEEQFRTLADRSPNMIFINQEGKVVYANRQSQIEMGYTLEEFLSPDFDFKTLIAAESLDLIGSNFRKHSQGEEVEPYDCTLVTKDGRRMEIIIATKLIEYGDAGAILGIMTDITAHKQTEAALQVETSYLEMLQAVTVAANEAVCFEDALQVALEHVCSHTGWPVGHVYLPDEEGEGRLVPSDIWYGVPRRRFKTLKKITEKVTFTKGVGLPGRVFATGKPAWIRDLREDKNFIRTDLVDDLGVEAGIAFPVLVGSKVVAVLEFFAEKPTEPDEKLLDIITHVGIQIGRGLERKAAEEALQMAHDDLEIRVAERTAELAASNSKFRHLFDHANDAIFIIDLKGLRIIDVNENAARQLGYTRKQLLKMKINDLAAPASSIDNEHILAEMQETGSVIFEHVHKRKDGSSMPVEISSRVIEVGDQQVIQSFVRDISERKEAEEHVRKLSMAVEQSPATVVITDTEGKIEYVNGQFTVTTGYSAEEAIGQNPRILSSGQQPKEFYRQMWETIAMGETWQGEFCNRKKNGEIYWESAIIAPITADDGRVTHFVAVKEDITTRKAAEAERERLLGDLENKNQDLQQILHISSHDLRSPLVSIQGFSGILDKALGKVDLLISEENGTLSSRTKAKLDPLLMKEIPSALDHIQASTEKMVTLLSGLMRLSRLGQAGMTVTDLDMNQMLSEIVKSINYLVGKSKVQLKIEDLPPSRGDEVLISQVFSNLLSNALKYLNADRPGIITITGERKDDVIVYTVEDNGIGIPPEFQPRVFDLFRRVDPNHTTGEGLGLTITRKIIERHHGRVWLESEPGTGSKFYVELPV